MHRIIRRKTPVLTDIRLGDCLSVLIGVKTSTIDSIVTDPPYEIGFIGNGWDKSGVAHNVAVWRECLRVLKPGGHMLAFSSPRTQHKMICAVEEAGFEIRDQLIWLYRASRPKTLNMSKEVDRIARIHLQWFGPWLRKHRKKLGLNSSEVDRKLAAVVGGAAGTSRNWENGYSIPCAAQFNTACKALLLPFKLLEEEELPAVHVPITEEAKKWKGWGTTLRCTHEPIMLARKPLAGIVASNLVTFGTGALNLKTKPSNNVLFDDSEDIAQLLQGKEKYFYCAKANKEDREDGNDHPCVKPTELMRHLCRLITPPGGLILDPFMGSGSTGKAARLEGFRFLGIEQDEHYVDIARRRIPAN